MKPPVLDIRVWCIKSDQGSEHFVLAQTMTQAIEAFESQTGHGPSSVTSDLYLGLIISFGTLDTLDRLDMRPRPAQASK